MKKSIIAVAIIGIVAVVAACNDKTQKAHDSTAHTEKPVQAVVEAFNPVNKVYECDVTVQRFIAGAKSSSTGKVEVNTRLAGDPSNRIGIVFVSRVGNSAMNIFPTSDEQAFAGDKSLRTIVDKNFRLNGLQFGAASVQYTNEVKMKSAEFLAWDNAKQVNINVKYSNCVLK